MLDKLIANCLGPIQVKICQPKRVYNLLGVFYRTFERYDVFIVYEVYRLNENELLILYIVLQVLVLLTEICARHLTRLIVALPYLYVEVNG